MNYVAFRLTPLSACLEAAHHFLLSEKEAAAIVEHQISAILKNWNTVCEEAGLSETDHALLWSRQYLNPFAFDDLERAYANIKKIASEMRTAKKE